MELVWTCLLLFVTACTATAVPSTDRDAFARFITLPKSRPPLFNVSIHEPKLVSPGYLFLAPYAQLEAKEVTDLDEAHLTGPVIFDEQGCLIWTGSAMFPGRDAYDFRVSTIKGESMLSFIISSNKYFSEHPQGAALRLNNAYELSDIMLPLFDAKEFNIHEYNIIDDGATALVLYSRPTLINEMWVQDDTIAEIELATGDVKFRWSSVQHIPLNSTNLHQELAHATTSDRAWDWIHANSVDKNADGNYLLSARHTSSIYKISGVDGSILWTLGGKHSDFEHLSGFNFSWQHDARFRSEDQSKTIISLFNNAGIGASPETSTGNWSQALIVELDTSSTPMTAKALHTYERPDRETSPARGNTQLLPNGNVFVGWASYGTVSEYTLDGTLAMQGRFLSSDMSSYRSYRFNFTGRPTAPPDIKSISYGTSPKAANTFHYVSWNGATDVHSWKFYGSSSNASLEQFSLLGSVEKYDFESMFMTNGHVAFVFAEAIGVDGNVMGRSIPQATEIPRSWMGTFCTADGCPGYENTGFAATEAKVSGGQHQFTAASRLRTIQERPIMLGLLCFGIFAFVYLVVRTLRAPGCRGRYYRLLG